MSMYTALIRLPDDVKRIIFQFLKDPCIAFAFILEEEYKNNSQLDMVERSCQLADLAPIPRGFVRESTAMFGLGACFQWADLEVSQRIVHGIDLLFSQAKVSLSAYPIGDLSQTRFNSSFLLHHIATLEQLCLVLQMLVKRLPLDRMAHLESIIQRSSVLDCLFDLGHQFEYIYSREPAYCFIAIFDKDRRTLLFKNEVVAPSFSRLQEREISVLRHIRGEEDSIRMKAVDFFREYLTPEQLALFGYDDMPEEFVRGLPPVRQLNIPAATFTAPAPSTARGLLASFFRWF